MSQEKSTLQELFRKLKEIATNKRAHKGARITYKVFWNLFLLFITIGVIGMFFAAGLGAGYFASLVKAEPVRPYEEMRKNIYNYEETTELYFANNVYLGKLRSDLEREEIKLDEMSKNLVNAVISTEDEYFYEHNGVVPKAIIRAILQEVTNSDTRTGGSTLTQQLIKNQILTNEVSFDRKAKEILLAMRLEKFFSKEQILEAYLNVASFGRNASGQNIAGVQAAAKGIFGVNAKDLNLAQAAFIAGLPQSPYAYTPFTNQGKIKEDLTPGMDRMKIVLKRMLTAGYIDQKQYDEAMKYNIAGDFTKPKPSSVEQYPWVTIEIEKRASKIMAGLLAKQDGYEEKDLQKDKDLYRSYLSLADQNLRQKGYKIYTTIDKDIYDKMQEVAKNYKYYGSDRPAVKKDPDTNKDVEVMEPVEVGAVLMENKTGKIISFVGGRDYKREQLNHATNGPRPNGSTMKPILVYAPAMEAGIIQPGTVLADTPYTYQGYTPHNYGGSFHGLTTIRNALQWSYNIPAVKTYVKIVNQRPVSYLENMGFTSLVGDDATNLSMALGGMTEGVSVEENVNAYATIGNNGKFVDGYMIDKIVTKDGETVYEHEAKPVDVFTPQTAYLTIDMMRDVVQKGTAASLKGFLNFNSDWAGKTGTGQDYKDAWFVATNPNVTFGVWIGYDTPKPLEQFYKGYSYSRRNLLLWASLINSAHSIKPELINPGRNFEMPGGIVSRSYCSLTGMLPSDLCQEAGLVKTDLFNVKYVPKEVDDSLIKGKYIMVNGKAYQVPPSAPAEFVQTGVMVKKEFLDSLDVKSVGELNELLPSGGKLGNLVVTENETIGDNGSAPSAVSGLSIQSGSLRWAKHPHSDIIGYRIYYAPNFSAQFSRLTSIPSLKSLQVSIPASPGAYYVTAVDVIGQESSPSAIIKNGDYQETPIPEPIETPPDEAAPGGDAEAPPGNPAPPGSPTPPGN